MVDMRTLKTYLRTTLLLLLLGSPLALTACSSYAPVPGGDDTTNSDFYKNEAQFHEKMKELHTGMSESDVFKHLGRDADDLHKLDREATIAALYGREASSIKNLSYSATEAPVFIDSLSGYMFYYKNVERKHGFTTPWRVKTTEKGYNYTVKLIFKDGHLYEKPILSGGEIRNSSSKTIFDWLSPGRVMDAAGI